MQCNDRSPPVPAAPAGATPPAPTLFSEELFRHGREVRIAHQGQCYTLRLTRENKLILTK